MSDGRVLNDGWQKLYCNVIGNWINYNKVPDFVYPKFSLWYTERKSLTT